MKHLITFSITNPASGVYEVRGDNGVNNGVLYGPVCHTRQDAETLKEDWQIYYDAPLVFSRATYIPEAVPEEIA